MRCPFCGYGDSKVLDTRSTDDGNSIRRRRECVQCGKRFTTYEKIEDVPLIVVKKDGKRQVFDNTKILNGLIKACEKRPVSLNQLEAVVNEIEKELKNRMDKEVSSSLIGELVMDKLKVLDEVAYVRFASVYREFKDISTFIKEIENLLRKNGKEKID
ncbi:MAG: transcriptional regulator NrdR [Clostridia bacterium]|nr:transcriptional regulator NrdR [Clostridia bacterium]